MQSSFAPQLYSFYYFSSTFILCWFSPFISTQLFFNPFLLDFYQFVLVNIPHSITKFIIVLFHSSLYSLLAAVTLTRFDNWNILFGHLHQNILCRILCTTTKVSNSLNVLTMEAKFSSFAIAHFYTQRKNIVSLL